MPTYEELGCWPLLPMYLTSAAAILKLQSAIISQLLIHTLVDLLEEDPSSLCLSSASKTGDL